MANILTGMRVLCGVLMLCFPAFSGWYFFFYLLGGFTDALDGIAARKTGTASGFGAKFDTVADFIFALCVGVKIIGSLFVPAWLIVWIAIIALIKMGSILVGYLKYHGLKTSHSALNKVCGGVVFLVILLMGTDCAWQGKFFWVIAVCLLASLAAIVEAVDILKKQPL